MSDLHLKLPPVESVSAAKRQFVELYGSTAVMNTYLKIAVLCLSLACVGGPKNWGVEKRGVRFLTRPLPVLHVPLSRRDLLEAVGLDEA